MIHFDEHTLMAPKSKPDLMVELTMIFHLLLEQGAISKKDMQFVVDLACKDEDELTCPTESEVAEAISDMVDTVGEEKAAEFLRSMLGLDKR